MAPSKFSPGNRDANEPEILEVANALGYQSFTKIKNGSAVIHRGFYIYGQEGQGCDFFFFDGMGCFMIEIKDDTQPKYKLQLTDFEATLLNLSGAYGLSYYVVYNAEDMGKLLSERIERGA